MQTERGEGGNGKLNWNLIIIPPINEARTTEAKEAELVNWKIISC